MTHLVSIPRTALRGVLAAIERRSVERRAMRRWLMWPRQLMRALAGRGMTLRGRSGSAVGHAWRRSCSWHQSRRGFSQAPSRVKSVPIEHADQIGVGFSLLAGFSK